MFENLTKQLEDVFNKLRRRGKLSAADVESAMREVRLALLEADVHYSVAKQLISQVTQRAVGHEVSRAINPAQQIIKIVNEELIASLGAEKPLMLKGPHPRVILFVGLQGSGKTTTVAKLALKLRSQGERVLMVAADLYRPAAIQQLEIMGDQIKIPVYSNTTGSSSDLASEAVQKSRLGGYTVTLIDTAGRSQLDGDLMRELQMIHASVCPIETLLVVDGMVGQEAIHIAKGFLEIIPISGLILTKMDGDARGGAAISIRAVTGIPVKFLGISEKLDGLEAYDPARLASRILGMGDVLGLIERAEAAFDKDSAAQKAEKLLNGVFTLEDFAEQIKQVRKMGPIGQLLDMVPGVRGRNRLQLPVEEAENQLKKTEAIINSMTRKERLYPKILNASRRRRIAIGSGTHVQDVNQLIKQYQQMSRLFKQIKKSGLRGYSGLLG